MNASVKLEAHSADKATDADKEVDDIEEVDDIDIDADDADDDVDDASGTQPSGKGFTKPAITRLARRAGVKSMSDDCIIPLKHLVAMKLDEVLSTTLIVNSQHATKTIMPDDVYEALSLCGINVARTEEF